MKRLLSFFLAFFAFLQCTLSCFASDDVTQMPETNMPTNGTELDLNVGAAVLMEAKTGKILYATNENQALPPASVTKIMTLLLVMEAIENSKISLTDTVTISEYASSMGGSQVFLEAGEEFSVEELIKCTVIASANDAAVALAEFVCGSESSFVQLMNERAKELGTTSTNFENVTGLDDDVTNHVTSAMDIAIMSRALISYPLILKYSSIWMDSIREGDFTLTNTNRLVRFYAGATGLKTGSTAKAKFCISATAKRDGMELICVIMAAPSRDIRNQEATRLLDYGFANYTLYTDEESTHEIKANKSISDTVSLKKEAFSVVIEKGKKGSVKKEVHLPEVIDAPLKKHDEVGTVAYSLDGQIIGIAPITAENDLLCITYDQLFLKMLKTFLHFGQK